jgi:tripartite-type tricarboxylate transporter receptor subunit TctC
MSNANIPRKPRILFEGCPLCKSRNTAKLRTADCSRHPLYRPVIAPTMTWMHCNDCSHVFTDGYFSPDAAAIIFENTHEHQKPGWAFEQQRMVSARIVAKVAQYIQTGSWLDVGFGNGSTVARITADRLSRIWGQQVVIENKPGAGTNIGAAAVAISDPDGYTMFIGSSSLATSRLLYRSLPYAISDLAPVTLVCAFPLLILAPNSSPAKSVGEFIAFARENKGKVTFASPGVGTVPHLTGELLKQQSGIEMTHVPYRGDAPALADTIAGRVNLQIGGSAMLEQIRSGQVRGLAVTTAKRSQLAPELPTVAEAGVPDFDVTGWFAFFVPARTSRGIVEKIYIDTVTALSDPTVKAKLENVGMVAIGSTPEELAVLLKAETEKWSAVIKEANIALD